MVLPTVKCDHQHPKVVTNSCKLGGWPGGFLFTKAIPSRSRGGSMSGRAAVLDTFV